MMGTGRRDLAWGFMSQFFQYGAALLLLPIMVTRLAPAEVGLWFVFMAIQALVAILDFGFSPTFGRNFAFVFAGVQEIHKEGVGATGASLNPKLLGSLIGTCQALYAGIALTMMLVLTVSGSWYLHTLLVRSPEVRHAWLAWGIFGLGMTINIFYSWYTPLLTGAGRVKEAYQVGILQRGGFSLLASAALLASGTLVAVAGAYLASVLVSRGLAGKFARPLLAQAVREPITREVRAILPIVWHNSYRSGIVSLGSFLITRFSVFVVSSFQGLAVSARYSVTIQVFSVVMAVSQVALVTFMPRFSALQVAGDKPALRRLFMTTLGSTWGIFCLLALGVIVLGNPALRLIHSRTLLLDRLPLLLLGIVWMLEANHAVCAAVITTANTVPFMKAAIVSGLAICGLVLLVCWAGWGLTAVILAQGIVQLSYNNWKWPLEVIRQLELFPARFQSAH